MSKLVDWIRLRYKKVWRDKYPWYWHIFDVILGFFMALIFVLMQTFNPGNTFTGGTLAGLFFAIWFLGYFIAFAFTYGLVRSRNAWTYRNK
ncbi:hypothetical protein [[Mycoplasma] mobile]|uniref:Uncharacterized protein n=1 Tax=Mycoplasma mobile (strain ATCC 43663 / 163K / NCTC 11711) TaxID=267748 RepID=Q6KIM6_MYCM1|nr:hypothetical protein [[Mycoplasma] mobile]AAT27550.1 hypothetical protein MMOB0640 [Mycoplasma mobile 163K]